MNPPPPKTKKRTADTLDLDNPASTKRQRTSLTHIGFPSPSNPDPSPNSPHQAPKPENLFLDIRNGARTPFHHTLDLNIDIPLPLAMFNPASTSTNRSRRILKAKPINSIKKSRLDKNQRAAKILLKMASKYADDFKQEGTERLMALEALEETVSGEGEEEMGLDDEGEGWWSADADGETLLDAIGVEEETLVDDVDDTPTQHTQGSQKHASLQKNAESTPTQKHHNTTTPQHTQPFEQAWSIRRRSSGKFIRSSQQHQQQHQQHQSNTPLNTHATPVDIERASLRMQLEALAGDLNPESVRTVSAF